MKIKYLRWLVLAAIFIVVTVGLVLNTNLGTLSSFGWQAIASICPLGVIESALAAKTIFPRALLVLAIVVIVVIVLGKFFCAWVCPVAPVRSLIAGISSKISRKDKSACSSKPQSALLAETKEITANSKDAELSEHYSSSCQTCTSKRAKIDSRHIILGGSLLSALIFGFPVFCLICPIGLIFGTVIIVWQFIGFEDISLSLLVYPLMLIIELLVLRKWCAKFCPLGALMSLLSLPNRFLRPVVNTKKCLRSNSDNNQASCQVCTSVCNEDLDPHCSNSLHECTKCGICKDKCPTGAISFALLPKKDAYQEVIANKLDKSRDSAD
jgi:ferredoxin-type protein NapH